MGGRVKEYIADEIRNALPEQTGAGSDLRNGAAYRQARAHVLEACTRGLVRMRATV